MVVYTNTFGPQQYAVRICCTNTDHLLQRYEQHEALWKKGVKRQEATPSLDRSID